MTEFLGDFQPRLCVRFTINRRTAPEWGRNSSTGFVPVIRILMSQTVRRHLELILGYPEALHDAIEAADRLLQTAAGKAHMGIHRRHQRDRAFDRPPLHLRVDRNPSGSTALAT